MNVSPSIVNEVSNEIWLHPSNASCIQAFQCEYSTEECFLPSLSYQFGSSMNF